MPQNVRQYIYPALLAATVVLAFGGVIAFWAAVSFEGYIAALMLFALAGISLFVLSSPAPLRSPLPFELG